MHGHLRVYVRVHINNHDFSSEPQHFTKSKSDDTPEPPEKNTEKSTQNGALRTPAIIPRSLLFLQINTSSSARHPQNTQRHPGLDTSLNGRRSAAPPLRLGQTTRFQNAPPVLRRHLRRPATLNLAPSLRRRCLSLITLALRARGDLKAASRAYAC